MAEHALEIDRRDGMEMTLYRATCACGWTGTNYPADEWRRPHAEALTRCAQDFERHKAEPAAQPQQKEQISPEETDSEGAALASQEKTEEKAEREAVEGKLKRWKEGWGKLSTHNENLFRRAVKAEKHCEEAIDDVVRAEKMIERRIEIEREDGTPFGLKFCEEILADLRATDEPNQEDNTNV